MTRAVAIVDGEHYAPVVRDALRELPYDFSAAVLVGGTEKLRGGEDYGVPLAATLREAVAEHRPELVYDLSDEPVLTPRKRLDLAARALALGVPYAGPGFAFEPPPFEPFPLPSIAVIGTGKRVGKTAVTTHVARLLAREHDVVVVAMGRGGPAEPELVETPPGVDDLLALAADGRHAASDHLETAALAGVVTIGCRRCGGGLAGAAGTSNVLAGARLAASLEPDVVVFDGSGAAIPPVETAARVLVAHDATGLNLYRVLISDLILVREPDRETAELAAAEGKEVLPFSLRLEPVEPLAGRRTAVFTAGPAATEHLDAEVVHVSRNLASRPLLRAELERVDAEVYLVEVKAAAIDVVARHARRRGAEVVFVRNDVVSDGLDERLLALVPQGAAK